MHKKDVAASKKLIHTGVDTQLSWAAIFYLYCQRQNSRIDAVIGEVCLKGEHMKRPSFFVSTMFCVWVSGVFGGQAYGEVVSVDLVSLPESHIDASVTVTAMGISRTDSDTTTAAGNVTAELGVYFDAGMPEVADVNSIRFTGGQLEFSDMSFTLTFSFLGKINATTTGLGGKVDSPFGAGAVRDENFETIDHVLILDRGVMYASGTGLVGGVFEPMTIDLADEPMVLSGDDTGSVSVVLESLDGNEATYSVTLTLPVNYDNIILDDGLVRIDFAGSGVVQAQGYFVRFLCPLRADLAGGDCWVDEMDLAVFVDQWLAYGDVEDCWLSADLSGADCYVDFGDFAVVAGEWLGNGVSSE